MTIISEYIAVPDHFAGAGAITWWTLKGRILYADLQEAWADMGLPPNDCPSAPSCYAALQQAVASTAKGAQFARRWNEWWLVCAESTDEDDRWRGTEVGRVRLRGDFDELEFVMFEDAPPGLEQKVRTLYQEARDSWGPDSLSQWLPLYLHSRCDATLLRRTGGVWYIPPQSLETFRRVQAVLCHRTSHYFAELEVLRTDRAVQDILDGLTHEIEDAIERALEEATTRRRAEHRVTVVQALADKLSRYEEVLQAKSQALADRIETAHRALALIAMSREEDDQG